MDRRPRCYKSRRRQCRPSRAVPRPGNHGNHRWKISAVQIWVGLVIQNPNLPKIMLRNRNRRWRHLFHSRMAPSPWPPIILHGRGVKRLNAEFPICSLNLIDPFRHLPHLRKTRGFLLLLSSFFLGSSSDENLEPPATSESPKYVGMSDGSSRKNPNLWRISQPSNIINPWNIFKLGMFFWYSWVCFRLHLRWLQLLTWLQCFGPDWGWSKWLPLRSIVPVASHVGSA